MNKAVFATNVLSTSPKPQLCQITWSSFLKLKKQTLSNPSSSGKTHSCVRFSHWDLATGCIWVYQILNNPSIWYVHLTERSMYRQKCVRYCLLVACVGTRITCVRTGVRVCVCVYQICRRGALEGSWIAGLSGYLWWKMTKPKGGSRSPWSSSCWICKMPETTRRTRTLSWTRTY